jgi:phosphotransferase system enzyme I (PtsP)
MVFPTRTAVPKREELLNALATLERVGRLAASGGKPRAALREIVAMVAEQMETPLCSLYLLEPATGDLVLAASTGLRFDPDQPPRLARHEGLVGLIVDQGSPVAVREASHHPRFKYLPETGEERFVSFLGVPVSRGTRTVGCLVVQTEEPRDFHEPEIHLLQTVAHQVAALVDTILHTAPAIEALLHGGVDGQLLVGTAASTGVAIGRAAVEAGLLPLHAYQASGETVVEQTRLDVALGNARSGLDEVVEQLRREVGEQEAALLDMQRLLLADGGSFVAAIEARVTSGQNAYGAIRQVALRHYHAFERLADPYIRQRGADVLEVGARLLDALCKGDPGAVIVPRDRAILVAGQVRVTDVLSAADQGVRGFVQGANTPDSHAVLLARAFALPMVTGVDLAVIAEGDRLIVDGATGTVHINSTADIEEIYQQHTQALDEQWHPPCSAGELPIRLLANISVERDLEAATAHGAPGIGLYRTEYAFLIGRDGLGREEEQYRIYSDAVRRFPHYPTTLRTLDLGGDKPFLRLLPVAETNPLLGLRAVRLSLHQPQVLRTQLRAMLRAAAIGPVRILFPMVTTVAELDQLCAEVEECRRALVAEGAACGTAVPLGVMVEVPAVARAGGALFAKADFVSIGSNDLAQYTLAVDRQSTTVAGLYQPLHPAVLHLIRDTVEAAHALGKPVSLCGELAASPVALPALLAIGLDEISVAPTAIPVVWRTLARLSPEACRPLLDDLLACPTEDAVVALLHDAFPALTGDG